MTESVNVISGRSAQRLRQILARYKGSPAQPPASDLPRGRTPLLVQCTSATAAGSGVGAECYPAVVVDTDPSQLLADQPTLGDVWLTLMDGSTPTADAYYEGLLAGEFDPDPGGAGTDPRLRVFSSPGAASGFVGAAAKGTTPQSIANNTSTNISWDNSEFDTSSFWSGGDPTKLTVPEDGYYHVGCSNYWQSGPTNYSAQIFLNHSASVTFAFQGGIVPSDLIQSAQTVTGIIHASAGDYFFVRVTQLSGVNKNAKSYTTQYSRFWCYKIG